jgi:uncharacterized lipoprotein
MKKVLVAFAVVAMFAACNDNTTASGDAKKDSTGTATPKVDSPAVAPKVDSPAVAPKADSPMVKKDSPAVKK